jgi:hypothetical protein
MLNMKKLLIVLIMLTAFDRAFAQTADHDAIKKTVNTLFDAMRKNDTVLLRSTFADGMMLQTIMSKKDGNTQLGTEHPEDFIKALAKPHKDAYDERITFADIKIDGPLASVWTPYKFYIGDKFSHCGVNVFQLMKGTGGWKIIYIVDTRRKDNCIE